MELPNGFEAVLVHRNYTDPGAGVVLARRDAPYGFDEWVCWCMNTSNDSFFWVVTQFSRMSVGTAYRAQTLGTLMQGIAGIITVWLLSLVLL